MDFKDYYKILNVDKNAAADAIETAYQQIINTYSNSDDSAVKAQTQEITEAYRVLAHPEKRARYDRLKASWEAHQQTDSAAPFDWAPWLKTPNEKDASLENLADFSDFYQAVFADIDLAEAEPQPGQDYHQELEISLEEAFNGGSRILQIGNRRIQVKIPRGVDAGVKIRVRGEGGKGQGGAPNGDLYLDIKITPHPLFERQGDDLHLDLPVDLYTAVLGGEAIVPMLKGKLKLKIPPETQSGRVFRLKGLGMPKLKQPDERGDLYAKVIIQIPQNLTEEEIALFEELADLRGL